MKKLIINLILTLGFTFSYSQNNEDVYPNFIGQSLFEITNHSEWITLVKAEGDLNNDYLKDYAIVLESKDSISEKNTSERKIKKQKPRILLVLISDNGNPKAIIQNNKFIARGDDGGMSPYIEPELTINNGLLKIFYQYTRSNQSYTFKYSKNNFKIINAKSVYVHAASGKFSSDAYDFIKNEITSNTGHISNDIDNTEILKMNIKPKSLSEFGEMYEWEVVKNKYL